MELSSQIFNTLSAAFLKSELSITLDIGVDAEFPTGAL